MNHRSLLPTGLGFVLALVFGWLAFPAVLYRSVEQPLQFSHRAHTGETVGMACEDCHSLSEDGRFTGIPALDSCAGCHEEAQGTSAAEKRFVEEYVAKGREVPWLVYARQPENAYFSHAPHVRLAEIPCERCHGPHGASESLRALQQNRITHYPRDVEGWSLARLRTREWERGMKMDECSDCHRRRGVRESCLTCHK